MALIGTINAPNDFGFKNRIINGDMRIDQRNAGAAISNSGQFPVDRFQFAFDTTTITAQRSTTVPAGFINSLSLTVGTGASPTAAQQNQLRYAIEGFNISDFGFGTANAQYITLSFWVRSSLTGTFAGSVQNNSFNRSFVFTFTINAANTYEYKTVEIEGDTTGTWLTDNSTGLRVIFDLGSGSIYNATAGAWNAGELRRTSGSVSLVATTGATFFITGVQLEKGSTATSFDYRPFGTELALCQRYFERSYNIGAATGSFTNGFIGFNNPLASAGDIPTNILFKVTKRDTPTVTVFNAISGASGAAYRTSDAASISVTGINYVGTNGVGMFTLASGSVNNYLIHYTASSEL